jgi:hypothetical protein
MTQISLTLGVPLGSLIDVARFDRVYNNSCVTLPDDDHKQLFASGWFGLGYRARAADERATAFAAAFPQLASSEDHCAQEVTLFDFVLNACAAAENIVFASFISARAIAPVQFKDKDLKTYKGDMVAAVRAEPRTALLGNLLSTHLGGAVGLQLTELRDFLVHRGRPPRWLTISLGAPTPLDGLTLPSNPKAIPKDWLNDFKLNAGTLAPYLAWLAALIDGATRELNAVLTPNV